MELRLLELSSLLYFLSALAFCAHVLWSAKRLERGGPLLLGLGFGVHGMAIALRTFSVGVLPVTGFAEGMSFFAWLMVGAYAVAQQRYRLAVIGAVVSPLAFVLTLGASLMYVSGHSISAEFKSPWLPIHVTLAFLGNAVFALAFAVSVIYLLQESLLKSHRRAWMLQKLPALEQLDRLNYVCLFWGFPLLSLGILTGGIWAANTWGRFWSGEPREILSIVLWLMYAGLLQFRLSAGLSGRRAALLTILGFGVLVVSYLAVNILPLSGRHGGGAAL
ncbi:MAG: cytochrome c biogenesis protein CcsA [Candidatus Binatia bacterium]